MLCENAGKSGRKSNVSVSGIWKCPKNTPRKYQSAVSNFNRISDCICLNYKKAFSLFILYFFRLLFSLYFPLALCVCAYLRLTHLRHIHTRRTHTHTHQHEHLYMASMGRLSVAPRFSSCAYAAVFLRSRFGARHEKSIDLPPTCPRLSGATIMCDSPCYSPSSNSPHPPSHAAVAYQLRNTPS